MFHRKALWNLTLFLNGMRKIAQEITEPKIENYEINRVDNYGAFFSKK